MNGHGTDYMIYETRMDEREPDIDRIAEERMIMERGGISEPLFTKDEKEDEQDDTKIPF